MKLKKSWRKQERKKQIKSKVDELKCNMKKSA